MVILNKLIESERELNKRLKDIEKQINIMSEKIERIEETNEELDSRLWDIEREEYATIDDLREIDLSECINNDMISEIIHEIGNELSKY